MSITLRQASTGYSQVVVFGPVMPAEATSTSIRPNSRSTSAAARSTALSSVTSTTAVCTRSSGRPNAALVSASLAASASHRLTEAPAAVRRWAIARPMPRAPPVMMALRPVKS